jgi:hypothetical protein
MVRFGRRASRRFNPLILPERDAARAARANVALADRAVRNISTLCLL